MKKSGILLLTLSLLSLRGLSQLDYPAARKTAHTDNYHGTIVADPYHWLEDDTSAATSEWVKEENKITFGYLDKIPYREELKKRIEAVYNYPKYSAPFRKGEYYYFYKNDGLQNQSVLFRQKGLEGKPEVVIDPNKLSPDGTSRLAGFSLSKDGSYAAWGISRGGSDWQTYFVRDMKTGEDLQDSLSWVKVSGIAWQGNGFYYSRYPEPEKGKELSSKNVDHQVWFHRVGTPQSNDRLIYSDQSNPQRFHIARTTEDQSYSILTISDRSKGFDGNALFYRTRTDSNGSFHPLIGEIGEYSYYVLDNIGDKFLVQTNDGAPNWKVVLIDTKDPSPANWKTVIPEKTEPIDDAGTAGGQIFVNYMKDVSSKIYAYTMEGKLLREIKLPAPGTAGGLGGNADDRFVFYTFNSFIYPPAIFRYEIASGTSTVFRKPETDFNPEAYQTKQVFYKSKDGTKVPMFIVSKKGIKKDGTNPTLLYAYGGFNISMQPSFSATLIPWLEQGGVYALANIRGGAEYGEKWHEAGMRFKKQNVFDDFIAAAEWLEKEKYTSPSRLVIRGGSNGGLLIGAVINQRPELFKVAIPEVGVMDMLRFHKFTIGWNWIAEYGSSDNPEEFKNLYAYSPLHNIKEDVTYPATLITTADHDDRVVPAHSFKYAATLQEKASKANPVLIRIDTKSGHGSSNTSKYIGIMADIYAFTFYNMGITPVFDSTITGGKKRGF